MSKIKDARLEVGLTRAELSKKYNIPIRTLEDWDSGRRKPSEWLENLIIRVINEDFNSQDNH